MDFSHGNRRNNYEINSKIMLIAVFSLCFVTLLVITLYIYARCILRHPRHRRPSTTTFIHRLVELPPQPKPGLHPTVINSLPSFPFKQSNCLDETECAVCLSALEDGEVARQLPNCNHVFHLECIDMWLSNQATCPICRSDPTPRLVPHPREPPCGSELLSDVVVVVSTSDECDHHGKGDTVASSSSPSFRLNSFRKMIGRDRSSSSSSSRNISGCGIQQHEIQ